MLLVAVDDVCVEQLREDACAQRVEPLAPHVPWPPEDPNTKLSVAELSVSCPKAEERGLHLVGHVTGQLPRVAFGTADQSILLVKKRRHDVQDAAWPGALRHGPGAEPHVT